MASVNGRRQVAYQEQYYVLQQMLNGERGSIYKTVISFTQNDSGIDYHCLVLDIQPYSPVDNEFHLQFSTTVVFGIRTTALKIITNGLDRR